MDGQHTPKNRTPGRWAHRLRFVRRAAVAIALISVLLLIPPLPWPRGGLWQTMAQPNSAQIQAGQAPASVKTADALPPYQLESGLVTRSELSLAKRWAAAITPDGKTQPGDSRWLDDWLGTALPFSFRYAGQDSDELLKQWRFQRGERKADADSEQEEFTWTEGATGLKVIWSVRRFTNYPAVEWVLGFENQGRKDSGILEEIHDLALQLNHSQKSEPYLVHGAHGGRYRRDDWWPFSTYVPSAARGAADFEERSKLELGGDYPSSRRDLPFFNLETPEGRGVIAGVGWTGSWSGRIRVEGTKLTARVGLKRTHFKLHPGERVRTCRILLLFWEGKRLHGQNMLRQLLHQHYIPRLHDKPQEPLVSANVCFTYHGKGLFLEKATEKEVLPLVDPFIRLGAELFIIDAGWYDGDPWHEWLGNWTYSRSKYPRGFVPISDPLAAANVAFGLWFAPELVNMNAPLLREHPEWVRPGGQQFGLNTGTLRIELPEAREWFLNQVNDLIENEGMTAYRQDGYNSAEVFEGEPADRQGIAEIHYITALYSLIDTVRERHPNLIMEAAVGAPRIDLETLSRFHWHQPCETWLRAEWDQCTSYGTSLWLPGGMIVFYTGPTDHYGAWSSFAGQLSVGWHPLDPDFPMDLARRQIALYKNVRRFLSGDFYPLTPISLDEAWLGYQFHRADLDEGFALVFRRSGSQVMYPMHDTFTLHLRGLDPESRYLVRLEGRNKVDTLTGEELRRGIPLAVDKAPGAEMIVYKKSD